MFIHYLLLSFLNKATAKKMDNKEIYKLIQEFEQTSDGFRQKHSAVPAEIPFFVIQKLDNLRRKGFLPPRPNMIIVNTHEELAIKLNSPATTEKLLNLITNLRTSDGSFVQKEPLLETLDIYTVYPREKFTQRMRYYFHNNLLVSGRIITVGPQEERKNTWQYNKEVIPVRPECVFVVRADSQINEEQQTLIKLNTKRFFFAHKIINALVYKKVIRGNFGDKTKWDHREAVWIDELGRKRNATQEKFILGIGPYLNFALQIINLISFPQPLDSRKVLLLVQKLIDRQLDPKSCFEILTNAFRSQNYYQIEIEAKGIKNQHEGAFVAHQLIGKHQLFEQAGIDYALVKERKININGQ